MPPPKKPFIGSRILLWAGFVAVAIAYVAWQNFGSRRPAPTQTPATNPAQTTATTVAYKDGAYTGTAANAFYGILQVKAVISGGKLADVQFLQYPSDRSASLAKSNQAMPILKQEAIAAQSANVDIVSGATQTSQAFQTSLASALSQAAS
ncbi:MAG: FMN-binding protein [Minisyncoccia bacterium]